MQSVNEGSPEPALHMQAPGTILSTQYRRGSSTRAPPRGCHTAVGTLRLAALECSEQTGCPSGGVQRARHQ